MKRIINISCYIFITLCSALSIKVNAHEYYRNVEFGAAIGTSHYFGDLNPNWGLKRPGISASLLIKRNINPYIALAGAVTYTNIGYDDALSNNDFQKQRNLNFSSSIVEASVLGEFNFLWFETGDDSRRFTPYIALGVSAFYYNPMADLYGKKQELRPLGTEGQNFSQYADRKYSNFNMAIPVGAGIKWWVAPGVNLNFSIINRFTFTDYLDDVSKTYVGEDKFRINNGTPTLASMLQDRSAEIEGRKMGIEGYKRGDESTMDQYIIAQVSITFQLKTYKCPKYKGGPWDASAVSY